MEIALVVPEALGLYFNDITALDIAVDHNKNFSAILKRMMRNEKVTTIFIIGDSTAANKDLSKGKLERGWGMMLQDCFDANCIHVDNHAVNGR